MVVSKEENGVLIVVDQQEEGSGIVLWIPGQSPRPGEKQGVVQDRLKVPK